MGDGSNFRPIDFDFFFFFYINTKVHLFLIFKTVRTRDKIKILKYFTFHYVLIYIFICTQEVKF